MKVATNLKTLLWLKVLLSTPAVAETDSLVIFTESLPPYNFVKDNKITGTNIEAVRLLCASAQLKCSFNMLPWNRAYRQATETPNSGIVSTARTSARENMFLWIGPLASSKTCFYKLTSRSDITVNKKSDLLSYKVGVSKNLAYRHYFDDLGFVENENLFLYYNRFGPVEPLIRGRIDLIVATINTLPILIESNNLGANQTVPIFPMYLGLDNYLALNVNTDKNIVDKLRLAMQEMIDAKTLSTLVKSFQPQPYTSMLEEVIPAALKEQCL